ncbi:Protein angel 2 [Quaeritorhiza haematococci]|nr:Protein angel 2 [Quaeritorhiza haematococci]
MSSEQPHPRPYRGRSFHSNRPRNSSGDQDPGQNTFGGSSAQSSGSSWRPRGGRGFGRGRGGRGGGGGRGGRGGYGGNQFQASKADGEVNAQPERSSHNYRGRGHNRPYRRGNRSHDGTPQQFTDRSWIRCKYDEDEGVEEWENGVHGASLNFSVMSYNILAESLVQNNPDLYAFAWGGITNRNVAWKSRGPRLLDEIKHCNADVICLQEVDNDHYDRFFKPALHKAGYTSFYKRRTGPDHLDGVALFVKTETFKVLNVRSIEYRRESGTDRDNVAIVLMLEGTEAVSTDGEAIKPRLCVATTHLVFNPKRGDIKMAQFRCLARVLEQTTRKYAKNVSIPVIICGDFNLTPTSFIYRFIRSGEADTSQEQIQYMSGQLQPPRHHSRYHTNNFSNEDEGDDESNEASTDAEDDDDTDTHSSPAHPRKRTRGSSESKTIVRHPFRLACSSDPHQCPSTGQSYFTTCHNGAKATVDYIFYGSVDERRRGGNGRNGSAEGEAPTYEGTLEQVEYLQPPLGKVMRKMPNGDYPSDHVFLVSRLRLRVGEDGSDESGSEDAGSYEEDR